MGGTPAVLALLLCAAAVVAALAAAAGARSTPLRLDSPVRAAIARGPAFIRDSTLRSRALPGLLQAGSYWGGQYTASTGETVTIYVSDAYPQDPATAQRWADFLASLVHGPELSSITAYLTTQNEIDGICGGQALACYSPDQNLLVAPGDDPSSDTSAEAVVTHEYGHHVAAHRSNAPWSALDYGTKRWASYEQVCTGARSGSLFPGAETLPRYRLNPGEAFAETYRVLNERKAGLAEAPWEIVSRKLYPTDTALAVLEQDVTSPWVNATTMARSGSLTRAVRARTYAIATSLDGSLKLTLRPPPGARFGVDVYSNAGTRLAHAAGVRAVFTGTTICGQRSLRVRVSRLRGSGTFRLAVATP